MWANCSPSCSLHVRARWSLIEVLFGKINSDDHCLFHKFIDLSTRNRHSVDRSGKSSQKLKRTQRARWMWNCCGWWRRSLGQDWLPWRAGGRLGTARIERKCWNDRTCVIEALSVYLVTHDRSAGWMRKICTVLHTFRFMLRLGAPTTPPNRLWLCADGNMSCKREVPDGELNPPGAFIYLIARIGWLDAALLAKNFPRINAVL